MIAGGVGMCANLLLVLVALSLANGYMFPVRKLRQSALRAHSSTSIDGSVPIVDVDVFVAQDFVGTVPIPDLPLEQFHLFNLTSYVEFITSLPVVIEDPSSLLGKLPSEVPKPIRFRTSQPAPLDFLSGLIAKEVQKALKPVNERLTNQERIELARRYRYAIQDLNAYDHLESVLSIVSSDLINVRSDRNKEAHYIQFKDSTDTKNAKMKILQTFIERYILDPTNPDYDVELVNQLALLGISLPLLHEVSNFIKIKYFSVTFTPLEEQEAKKWFRM
jgi:hypothetical protein